MVEVKMNEGSQDKLISRSKKRRLVLWGVLALLVVAVVGIFGVSAYVGWNLTHPVREKIDISPEAVGLAFEDVSFKSRIDGLDMKGWLIKAPDNKKTVIFAHGYRKNRLQDDVPVLSIARTLVDKGYNVLLFDFRNCGNSEGIITSVGQHEVRDLLGAVDFIKSRPELNPKIVLFGFSMGASTSILAGAREPSVAAVIADSPFADLKSYLMANLSVWTDLPAVPFNQAFLIIVPHMTGLRPDTVSPIKEIKNFNNRPLLLIHGEEDTDISIENSELLQKNYPNVNLWRVPKAKHIKAYAAAGDLYLEKVLDFLDKV